MNIGNVKIKTPVFLAPMAGITDYSFRTICKEMGAGMVYSEFVSSDGIIRENSKTLDMIKFKEEERPIGIQIFGNNPKVMGSAAFYVNSKFAPDIIDINYGCPVPKVTKRGGGSAALKDLCLMDDITAAVIESVPDTPVTVKMRIGWDNDSIIIPEAGIRLEKLGIKAITLHARTTKQRYKGNANWRYIKLLKQSVSIPIIGNGDIFNFFDIKRMFEYTNCDAVMVARASLGNPWFFKVAKAGLRSDSIPPPPTLLEIYTLCERHFKLLLKDKGKRVGTNLMRQHFSNYIKGFPGASAFRQRLVTSPDLETMKSQLSELKKFLKSTG
mgnify:FL=1